MEARTGGFSETFRNVWDFNHHEKASCIMRLYSTLHIPQKYFADLYMKHLLSNISGNKNDGEYIPVIGCISNINEFKSNIQRLFVVGSENGIPTLHYHNAIMDIPKSPYILLAVPYKGLSEEKTEQEVYQTLDELAALLRMYLGEGSLFQKVYEAEYEFKKDIINQRSEIIKIGEKSEEVRLYRNAGQSIKEMYKQLNNKGYEKYKLALHFMNRSYDENDVYVWFSLAYTALEILCGKSRNNIRNKLKLVYNCNNAHDIGKKLYIDDANDLEGIASLRGEMLHRGLLPNLSGNTRTLIGLLVLDIIRFELNLPLEQHALKFVASNSWQGLVFNNAAAPPVQTKDSNSEKINIDAINNKFDKILSDFEEQSIR